ncbi:MAG: zinc-dependent dehydrogenase [Candidatus Hadarchaeales archaeon]
MRVAVYYAGGEVRVEERPRPEIGPGEFLLKVMACGICGTDVLGWYRDPQAPRVLGHEAAGVVEEVGEGTERVGVGDRVFVSHHVPCGQCRYCRRGHETACETLHTTNYDPGGFSEYVRVPRINVERGTYLLPPQLSFEEATFIEPVGCTVRAQRLAGVGEEDTVLILGSGVSGLLHLQLAKLRGAGTILVSDVQEYRLEAAKRFGTDFALKAGADFTERVREVLGKGADQVIVCTGSPQAAEQALKCVDRGGTVLFFAVPPPEVQLPFRPVEIWRDEVRLMTSYGAAPRDLEEALDLLRRGRMRVKEMVTHRLGLGEIAKGFKLVAEAGESLKVVVEPQR